MIRRYSLAEVIPDWPTLQRVDVVEVWCHLAPSLLFLFLFFSEQIFFLFLTVLTFDTLLTLIMLLHIHDAFTSFPPQHRLTSNNPLQQGTKGFVPIRRAEHDLCQHLTCHICKNLLALREGWPCCQPSGLERLNLGWLTTIISSRRYQTWDGVRLSPSFLNQNLPYNYTK